MNSPYMPPSAVQRQGLDSGGPLFKAVSGELSNLRQGVVAWLHGPLLGPPLLAIYPEA